MKESDAQAHDAMMCISNGEYLGQPDRKQVSAQQYLKTPSEMRLLFADLPEAIENTVEIARRCSVKAEKHAPILPNFSNEGRSESEELRKQALEGLELRLKEADQLYADGPGLGRRVGCRLGAADHRP